MSNDLRPLFGLVDASQRVTATVGEVRDAENDGPLESTDLHVEGRGISLLVNVLAGSRFTYALNVDGATTQSGTVGGPVDDSGEPRINPRAWEMLTEEEESIAAAAVPSSPAQEPKE